MLKRRHYIFGQISIVCFVIVHLKKLLRIYYFIVASVRVVGTRLAFSGR
jgi:hypothetical protein